MLFQLSYLYNFENSISVNKTMPHLTKEEPQEGKEPGQQSDGYHQFVEIHGPQLLGSGVPDFYWPKLFEKLGKEVKLRNSRSIDL